MSVLHVTNIFLEVHTILGSNTSHFFQEYLYNSKKHTGLLYHKLKYVYQKKRDANQLDTPTTSMGTEDDIDQTEEDGGDDEYDDDGIEALSLLFRTCVLTDEDQRATLEETLRTTIAMRDQMLGDPTIQKNVIFSFFFVDPSLVRKILRYLFLYCSKISEIP